MDKYDVVKDWEKIDFGILESIILSSDEFWTRASLRQFKHDLESFRDKQLKTFPRLERK